MLLPAGFHEVDFSRAWTRRGPHHLPAAMALPPAPALPAGPWLVAVAATNTAWSGPWGVSFTANITPDLETGLGKWTLRNFTETVPSWVGK